VGQGVSESGWLGATGERVWALKLSWECVEEMQYVSSGSNRQQSRVNGGNWPRSC
jgi:hypothetical protein